MSVLVLIPARAGSQRVKNKNIRLVKKKPLVCWTIEYAKKLKEIYSNLNIVVSTDCPRIKEISKLSKIYVIERPKDISGNKASMHSVISHVLKKIDAMNKIKYVVLLQPTSPIRKINWVLKGIEILNRNPKFENLIHLTKLNKYIGKLKKNEWKPEFSTNTRSQDILNQLEPSGCLFIYKRKNFDNKRKFDKRLTYGFVSNNFKTVNIDFEEDFVLLDYYIKKSSLKKLYK